MISRTVSRQTLILPSEPTKVLTITSPTLRFWASLPLVTRVFISVVVLIPDSFPFGGLVAALIPV